MKDMRWNKTGVESDEGQEVMVKDRRDENVNKRQCALEKFRDRQPARGR